MSAPISCQLQCLSGEEMTDLNALVLCNQPGCIFFPCPQAPIYEPPVQPGIRPPRELNCTWWVAGINGCEMVQPLAHDVQGWLP